MISNRRCWRARGVRQSDIAAAKLLSEAEVAAAVEAADRGHFNRIVAAGARTDMRAPNTEAAVTEHPRQQESVTATDDTLFLLDGGCYDVQRDRHLRRGRHCQACGRG